MSTIWWQSTLHLHKNTYVYMCVCAFERIKLSSICTWTFNPRPYPTLLACLQPSLYLLPKLTSSNMDTQLDDAYACSSHKSTWSILLFLQVLAWHPQNYLPLFFLNFTQPRDTLSYCTCSTMMQCMVCENWDTGRATQASYLSQPTTWTRRCVTSTCRYVPEI